MNTDKIEKLIGMLRSHPLGYEQSTWGTRTCYRDGTTCGTKACLACYTVLMEGYLLWFGPGKLETSE